MSNFVRAALALAVLLAAGCGWGDSTDPERVRFDTMPYRNGVLAETWDHGDHYHVGIADVLVEDSDPDRPVRVCVKELLRCLQREDQPDDIGADWYLHSADTQDPYAPFPEAEAAWIASFQGSWPVECAEVDWLIEDVDAACARVNDAAGRDLFRRE